MNILIGRRYRYKTLLRKTILVPTMSTSLQKTLASEAHIAEGQILPEKQILDKEKSLIY
jgi:hypothetical protein